MLDKQRIQNNLALVPQRPGRIAIPSAHGPDAAQTSTGVITIAWRQRWVVLACVAAAIVASFVYLEHATPIYSSSSVVYIQQSVPKAINDQLSTDDTFPGGYLFTQCQVITSTANLSNALQLPSVAAAHCLQGLQDPIGFLKGAVTAQPGKQANLATVSMESTDPQDAAVIVNGVVESYIDYQSQQHRSTAVEVLKILQKEMDRHETELAVAERALENFRKANPDMAFETGKGNLAMDRLSAVQSELALSQQRIKELENLIAQVRVGSTNDADKLGHLFDEVQLNSSLQGLINPNRMEVYEETRQKLGDLTDELGPDNFEVIECKQRLAHGRAPNYLPILAIFSTSRSSVGWTSARTKNGSGVLPSTAI